MLWKRLLGIPEGVEKDQSTGWGWSLLVAPLIGILSITILAAQNADRGIRPWDLLVPLSLALPIAAVAWVGAGLVVREAASRGVLAGIVAGVMLFGGGVAGAFPAIQRLPWGELAFLSFLLAVPLGWWIYRTPSISPGVPKFLVVAGLALLTFNALAMRPIFWEHAGNPADQSTVSTVPTEDRTVDHPDVYFILLDSYTGPRSLKEIYGLDIVPFMESLEGLGFEVAEASHANYTSTFLGMSAMLDWNYPEAVLETKTPDDQGRAPLYRLLHDNATTSFLREEGYTTIFYRSSYPPLRSSPIADIHVPAIAVAEFEITWLSQTMILGMIRGVCRMVVCGNADGPQFLPDAASDHEAKFRALITHNDPSGPYFHLAHFLLPHEPFLFHADCSRKSDPYWPSEITEVNELRIRNMYADQVECTNSKVLETVKALLAQDGRDPIIILQSDHGYARFAHARPLPLNETSADRVRERMDLFAAYYLPEGVSITYPGITPVNAMRSLFREVFGLDLDPVEDRSYWSSFPRPYDFTRLDMVEMWAGNSAYAPRDEIGLRD